MLRSFSFRLLAICTVIWTSLALHFPATGRTENIVESPAIVIGFLGGFVRHDNPAHLEFRLAERLRKDYDHIAVVDTFENRNGEKAYQEILKQLDVDHDGTLSDEEKRNARIILYGHSWGASESIALARLLEKDAVPVLLTVQVDSVSKIGEDDQTIPGNVAEAVNFYQLDGLLHGESKIHAADSTRTKILGNFRFSYGTTPYRCTNFPWYARIFMRAHTQIECDPKVWNQVEALIRSRLPPESKTVSVPHLPGS